MWRQFKTWSQLQIKSASMSIELYHSPHCTACESLVEQWTGQTAIRRLDVCKHLERAARLGISHPPALVVNGQLLAQGAQVKQALAKLAAAQEAMP